MNPLLVVRRARRDIGILVVWIALVAFAVALAVGQPRLLQQTVDAGARQAVATAGSNTDVVVSASVSPHRDSGFSPVAPGSIEALAAGIPKRLPAGIRSVYLDSSLTVVGPSTQVSTIDGAPPTGTRPIAAEVAMLTTSNRSALHLVSGSLPGSAAAGGEIGIVLSQAAANASGLRLGSVARVATIPIASEGSAKDVLALRVVGIVSETSSAAWTDLPTMWTPTVPHAASAPAQITVLTSPSGVAAAAARYDDPFKAYVRVRLDPKRFTAAREATVSSELVALSGHDENLGGSIPGDLATITEYGKALAGFPARERAAVAQISVMAAGVLGVAAAVLLLVSRMLVARREPDIALERARGASIPSIAGRAFLETVIAGILGVALGVGVIEVAAPGPFVEPSLLVFVVVVALVAVPGQSILRARTTWTGRRVAANRVDRIDAARRVRARRIAIELTIVVLAVAAFISLATRGLLETQTNGVDLLLAAAPLLLAATITIVILRVYRGPLAIAIAAGRHSIGALGLLAAVRAQRSIAVLPLLALTLSVGLAVGGGLLASTVAAGQETASWQRIGADVRVDAGATDAQLATIAGSPGVTGATTEFTQDGIQLRLKGGTNFATVIAIDSHYPGFVERLPAAGASRTGAAVLRKLLDASDSSDAIPAVVDRDLASQVGASGLGMYVGVKFVSLRVVGVTDENPAGYLDAPFVFVDRAALAKKLGTTLTPTMVLVNGPGAAAAVDSLDVPASHIQTRSQWLSARRSLALVSGVDRAITLATLATALLAIIALIVTLLSGARERGRSLALIRTLGLPARLGWWLALAELAPVLVAALVGGVAAGLGIVLLLEPALGLRELAGGLGDPAPSISIGLLVGMVLVAIGLLLVAVLVEIVVRRRDRLSEVLRVGETT